MGIFSFKVNYSNDKTYLTYAVGKKQINFMQIKSFSENNFFECFVPFECTKTGKNGKVNFDISGLTSLSEFLKVDIKQEQYFSIISDIQKIMAVCRSQGLKLENLIFNTKYMYYQNTTGKILMAYVPLVNNENKFISGNVAKCLCGMQKCARISISNGAFMDRYENYLKDLKKNSKQSFNSDSLYNILSEMGYAKKDNAEKFRAEEETNFDGLYKAEEDEGGSATVIRIRTALPGSTYLMDKSGNKIEIKDFPFRIGREKDNDLVISSDMVSSHHAEIVHEGDEYYIVDKNSGNGTYLNDIDNRVLRAKIVDKSRLFFDMFEYTFKTTQTQIDEGDSDDVSQNEQTTENERPLAYIKKLSDDSIIKIMRYPFTNRELSQIIFFEKKFAGETLLYMENTSCNSLRLENIEVPIGEKVEIFSGCSLFINDELYTFIVEN